MTDETREIIRSELLEVVDNQLRDKDPPQTLTTYKRLIGQGYSDEEARRLIAFVVVSELNDVMKDMEAIQPETFR